MKILKLLFLIVHCTLVINNCLSQWQPDVRLTSDGGNSFTSLNNAWCIASSGNTVYVVWFDDRDANTEIYFKRSIDGGINWGADTRLTNNSAISEVPSIIVNGSTVHIVWDDYRNGNSEIYYKRSTDEGVSWGADIRLTSNSGNSLYPTVSVSASVVHVVWYDTRDSNREIYYKRSADDGISWGTDTRLTNNSANSYFPSVSISGLVVHVIWYDERDGGNAEIYYKRSTDGGITWEADTRLTNNTAASESPSIAVSGSFVHAMWIDDRDGNREIYYKRSTDGGNSWGADTRLTNNSAFSQYPSVSVSGSVVHVLFEDQRDGNQEIYYKRSADGGNSWSADTRLTNNIEESTFPSVCVSGQTVHIVWQDSRDGNQEIYYKRNPTGNPVGIIIINSEIPKNFSLLQNYPNPFNPTTNFGFRIAEFGFVSLKIYNQIGEEVTTLINDDLQAGTYEYEWNALNLPSGVYFYKLITSDFIETKKMMLVK